ncbi:MAG: P-loop NTPase [Methylotenera sp.]|nr:P-loop NTPase [Oligoflexia bacterium]
MAFWNRKKTAQSPTSHSTGSGHVHSASCSHGAGHSDGHTADPEHSHAPAGATATARAPTPQAKTTGPSTPQSLSAVKNIIAIASGKGGVGKSTVTANLAVALRFSGATVGIMDADIYGPSQPGMFGANANENHATEGQLVPTEKHGVKFMSMGLLMGHDGPVVWRAPMAMKVIQQFISGVQWGSLDYLLLDLPPGTGDVQLTIAQQAALSGAVIVTTPQEVALGIAKKGLKMFEQLNVPILGIVENMSGFTCKHCGVETAIFKEGGGARLAKELGVPFLGSLPLDPEIMMSGDEGIPVLAKTSESPAAQAILAFSNAVQAQMKILKQTQNGTEPEEITLAASGEVLLRWPNDETSVYRAHQLRVNCGCAMCVDENTGKRILDPNRVPLDIQVKSVDRVGRYAVTVKFSDGHNTGIYPFKNLQQLASQSRKVQQEAFDV